MSMRMTSSVFTSSFAVLMTATVAAVGEALGRPQVVVHNAVGGAFGDFLSIDPSVLERNFQVNVMALLQLARLTTPAMIERNAGALVVTANTAAAPKSSPDFPSMMVR